ncbi:50S ribosomal protein L30 [Acholeplasma vituli]|jgi:large subunit ribosomal protein L30|uniref:50S ribosomal protein L30 n=2 Tax=Paracholeplasma TaxID=2903107 RepID=A0ABT2PTG2_9MOLU|nr:MULTISPECIES: 50S ribosomal protein L30 [Paracholeplasma]MCU0104248.1 50S ribosomal protein L30 [Paracholeplasma vituli]MCV2231623.1 50S ribosomal protein L30 [Paracholeplasma manati]MDG0888634.1 50S ribosomal protein L30 [Paracholeplasma manati]MDX9808058.1 50S ribosomal protein L30 [Acholeplasma sp.]
MTLEITLKKSLIGRNPNQVRTAHALGLKKLNQTVVKESNDAIVGMVKTIAHLVVVKEIA